MMESNVGGTEVDKGFEFSLRQYCISEGVFQAKLNFEEKKVSPSGNPAVNCFCACKYFLMS